MTDMSMMPATTAYTTIDGKPYFVEEYAVEILVRHEVLEIHAGVDTVGLMVCANDLFAWGCADSEPVKYDELESLYQAWDEEQRTGSRWAVAKWVCKHRHEQPQAPVIVSMKQTGAWDASMEELPANTWERAERLGRNQDQARESGSS